MLPSGECQRPTRPALLVSIHDVSPLTLDASRRAVALVRAAGISPSGLTLLVVPRHEDRVGLDEDAATRAWLTELAGDGAHLVMHGYTHRMSGHAWTPRGLVWAHGFARGQGELFRSSAEDAQRRLTLGRAILAKAGLVEATHGFVPPAWLLSRPARAVVAAAGFAFYEGMSGIITPNGLRARRLVGWGSLGAVEASLTTWWAAVQRTRAPTDTRLAIHPADLTRPRVVDSIRRCLATLLDGGATPLCYRDFLSLPAFSPAP